MITFISGVPGSGKTYYAVTIMKNDKNRILTNIDIKKDIEVCPFVWADFYKKISRIYKYKENADKAIKLAKRFNIYGVSIYYDECHLELDKQNRIVVWWLSWHRHISQTIYLITQSKGTIAQKYRAYPEIFIDARPATLRMFGSVMRYKEYASYKMGKDDLIRKFFIKIDPKIFEIYRTGAFNKGKSSLRNKVYLILAFAAVPILIFYFLFTRFTPDKKTETTTLTPIENNTTLKKSNTVVSFDENNSFNVYCSTKTGCKFGVVVYKVNEFKSFILPTFKKYKEEVIALVQDNNTTERITRYTLLEN